MFRGSLVAIVTPFNSTHEIDYAALGSLIEWHLDQGTHGFVMCGTTGEGITLTDDEQYKVLQFTLDLVNKRAPVIMGTGSASTQATVKKTEKAKKLGADACLVILPYCNKPTERGCLQHFLEIAKVNLPTIIYHHPGRTGIKLSLNTFKELAEIPSIMAIKECSGDLPFIESLIQGVKLPILAGDDMLTYPMLQRGAQGAISVIANIIPKEWSLMVRSALERNSQQAMLIHKKYQKLNEVLMLETNPQGIKYAMHVLGKCLPSLRLPLVEPTDVTKKAIEKSIKSLQLI